MRKILLLLIESTPHHPLGHVISQSPSKYPSPAVPLGFDRSRASVILVEVAASPSSSSSSKVCELKDAIASKKLLGKVLTIEEVAENYGRSIKE